MFWLILIMSISILLNGFCIWYIKTAVKKLWFVSENIGGLLDELEQYRDHLSTVNAMETYYGDAIIENLMRHTKDMLKRVSSYHEIYSLTHDEPEEGPDPEKESEQQ